MLILYINSIGFLKSKILCVCESSFCSFAEHVYVLVYICMTYLHVCLCIRLYFVCACYLFVEDLYMFLLYMYLLVGLYICVFLCVFVFTIPCECVFTNCQTIRALQQFQTVSKFPCKRRKCSTDAFSRECKPYFKT